MGEVPRIIKFVSFPTSLLSSSHIPGFVPIFDPTLQLGAQASWFMGTFPVLVLKYCILGTTSVWAKWGPKSCYCLQSRNPIMVSLIGLPAVDIV